MYKPTTERPKSLNPHDDAAQWTPGLSRNWTDSEGTLIVGTEGAVSRNALSTSVIDEEGGEGDGEPSIYIHRETQSSIGQVPPKITVESYHNSRDLRPRRGSNDTDDKSSIADGGKLKATSYDGLWSAERKKIIESLDNLDKYRNHLTEENKGLEEENQRLKEEQQQLIMEKQDISTQIFRLTGTRQYASQDQMRALMDSWCGGSFNAIPNFLNYPDATNEEHIRLICSAPEWHVPFQELLKYGNTTFYPACQAWLQCRMVEAAFEPFCIGFEEAFGSSGLNSALYYFETICNSPDFDGRREYPPNFQDILLI